MRIARAQHACLGGAAEVIGDDLQSAPRRIVCLGVERQHDGRRVHGDDNSRGQHLLDEWDELLRDAPQHDARIGFRVDVRKLEDAVRRIEQHAALHRQTEQRLLRVNVAQDRGRRDLQLAGDVGEGRGGEALCREHATGGVDEALAGDGWGTAHL